MGPGAGRLESFLPSLFAAISKVGIATTFFTMVNSSVTTKLLPVNISLKMSQKLQKLFWGLLGFA